MPIIRPEIALDHEKVFAVHVAAFGRMAEADLVNELRKTSDPLIAFVAEQDHQIVGHIMFSPVRIANSPNPRLFMGLGPVAVIPQFQRKAIGSALIQTGIRQCHELNVQEIVVLGHKNYYPRFGFLPAQSYGLFYKHPQYDSHFFALELTPGALSNESGEIIYSSAFNEIRSNK